MSGFSKLHRYDGGQVSVTWDEKRCIHAAECLRRLPAVFDIAARPWIRPDAADPTLLAAAIHACPSGALSFTSRGDAPGAMLPAANRATLTANGPIWLRGDLVLLAADGSTVLEDTRIALCRCGTSRNKPFCDGSHRQSGFVDDGTLRAAETPGDGMAPGGSLAIRTNPNGPVVCTGTLTIVGTNGRTAVAGTTFLCRCGHSRNKPYCDGTHRKTGFVTE